MLYQQNCNNLDIKYYENLIKIDIINIRNNVENFRIYENVLQIFKLNQVNMIIKYQDIEYLIVSGEDLKRIFKNFINV